MVRVKPTEATAHNNILPSRSMASSNTATARKLGLEDNQDTVGRHQGTVKDHHREARQAATDNKVWKQNIAERKRYRRTDIWSSWLRRSSIWRTKRPLRRRCKLR
jgi:hypothetical protein